MKSSRDRGADRGTRVHTWRRAAAGLLTTITLMCLPVSMAVASPILAGFTGSASATILATGQTGTSESILGLGDSVTSGYAADTSYVNELANLQTTSTNQVTATNLGIPGLTTDGLKLQLGVPAVQTRLATANVVVITIGANDFSVDDETADDRDQQLGELHDQVAGILQSVHRLAPNATVVVTGYWDAFADADVIGADEDYAQDATALTNRINAVLQQASAEQGVSYVDLAAAYAAQTDDVSTLLAEDGDHPNDEGHRVIARAVNAVLPQPVA